MGGRIRQFEIVLGNCTVVNCLPPLAVEVRGDRTRKPMDRGPKGKARGGAADAVPLGD